MRRLIARIEYGLAAACLGLAAATCTRASGDESRASVSTGDVHRFVAAWRLAGDSSCAPFRAYLDSASPGLRAYANKFDVHADELCTVVRRQPARYAAIVTRLPALDTVASRADTIFARFRALDPSARMPSGYFVVGNGIAAGTTTRGRNPTMLFGAELITSPSGLTWTIAHELTHTQQRYPLWGSLTGGPKFLRATVLRQAITEGSADFIAEVLTHTPKRNAYAEAHEAALWTDFRHDLHSRDYGKWFYNGRNANRGELPPDLGYWVGYRIVKSYYDRQTDKPRAIREILTIRDFDAFLAASRYTGAQ